MNSSLRFFFVAAMLAATLPLSAAERWSTDETALRMGIRSWLSIQSSSPKAGSSTSVAKALYVSPPTAAQAAASKYYDSTQPENISIKLQDNQATTSFQLPQPSTQVVLQWERKGGLWKIARETVTPVTNTAEQVALSGSSQK